MTQEAPKLTEEQQSVISAVLDDRQFLIVSGKAGVGKSFTTKALLAEAQERGLRYVVLASTGIAAIAIGGITIHRFINVIRQLYSPLKCDVIVIDECSMVRADLLDRLNSALQKATCDDRPFGGVPVVLVGDLRQLPPVVTDHDKQKMSRYRSPYFFSADCFPSVTWRIIQLTQIFRQRDEQFIKVLNDFRDAENCEPSIEWVNNNLKGKPLGTILTPTNAKASRINNMKLAALPGEQVTFAAAVKGDFTWSEYPTEASLPLKLNARVMCVKNLYSEKDEDGNSELIVCNGDIGIITELNESGVTMLVHRTQQPVKLAARAAVWEKLDMVPVEVTLTNGETAEVLEEQVVGSFAQLPLRLAWAITVHKSQGMSLPEMTIDLTDKFFAAGQAYVAFSRSTDPKGLRVLGHLTPESVMACPIVGDFLEHGMESRFVPEREKSIVEEWDRDWEDD